MKANTKYTALEVLTEAGFENPGDKIGKFRCRIGGISGIVSPDHVVKFQTGLKKVDVILGNEVKTVDLDGDAEHSELSEGTEAAKEGKSEKIAEQNEARAEKKAEEVAKQEKENTDGQSE